MVTSIRPFLENIIYVFYPQMFDNFNSTIYIKRCPLHHKQSGNKLILFLYIDLYQNKMLIHTVK